MPSSRWAMFGGLGYYFLGHRLRFSAVVRAGLVDFCGTSGFGPWIVVRLLG